MLGKLPARKDVRTLKLARYLDRTALPTPPASVSWSHAVDKFPMDGNDRYGDCGFAGVHHQIQTLRSNDKQPPLKISEQDVVKAYLKFTGNKDVGVVLLDVLKAWKTKGIFSGKIAAFASVNMQDLNEVRTAIYLFGSIYAGVELPAAWQGANRWSMPSNLRGSNAPGSWGGHCVTLPDYDATGFKAVTWGGLMPLDAAALRTYFSEGYVMISPDWLGSDNIAPNGFKGDVLQQDLGLL